MKNFISVKGFFKSGVGAVTAFALSQTIIVCPAFGATSTAGTGEVLNLAEQGTSGEYTVTKTGYYMINLKGANGGDGQDVEIESDGVGSTEECIGHAYGYGGAGAEGGSVSALVYLEKGQTVSYNIGADGTNYTEVAYRWEDLQRGCIHVYPNSNPIYQPEKYVDAGYGGGGGEGTYVSVDDVILAGAAGGGGGGGSVAKCANWGEGTYMLFFKDPSGEKSEGKNGGDASAVSETIAESLTDVSSLNGCDGEKSQGESVQTGEYYPAVGSHPKAPKYKLTKFEAGAGGETGTSYVNTASDMYRGDDIPEEVSSSDLYKNATSTETSGIKITFILGIEFPVKIEFTGDEATTGSSTEIQPGETVEIEIPKPSVSDKYFKGWFNKNGEKLVRDYYDGSNVTVSYEDITDGEYTAEWYDEADMGKAHVSNAKAQAVTLANGKKAIRFLAAIDGDYKNYTSAGFIISGESQTPTVEAGYQYSVQSTIYGSIFARLATGERYINAKEMADMFGFGDCTGLIYTNLIVKEGKESTTYYATPYVVYGDEYVYGAAKTVTYDELVENDAAVASDI